MGEELNSIPNACIHRYISIVAVAFRFSIHTNAEYLGWTTTYVVMLHATDFEEQARGSKKPTLTINRPHLCFNLIPY